MALDYYLLKLETLHIIEKGHKLVDNDSKPLLKALLSNPNEYPINSSGYFWTEQDGYSDEIPEKYSVGDIVESDIYEFEVTLFCLDNWLTDEVFEDLPILLEMDLLSQWTDKSKPITFLMRLSGYFYGADYEFEGEHYSIKVVTDLSILA